MQPCYTYAVPSPTVTLTVLSSADCRDHVVGGTFSVRCQATVSHHVNTPVSVNITWGRTSGLLSSGSNSRVTISETTAVSGLIYRSILTLSDLSTGTDSNMNYYCQAAVTPDPVSSYISASTQATSNTYHLAICGMVVVLHVIPVTCTYSQSTLCLSDVHYDISFFPIAHNTQAKCVHHTCSDQSD